MRSFIISTLWSMALVVVGGLLSPDHAEAGPITHEHGDDFMSLICAEIAYARLKNPGSIPNIVPPKPAPGACSNCGGDGRVGDGTISVPCVPCKGTGRITSPVVKPVAKPKTEVDRDLDELKRPVDTRCECVRKTGKCDCAVQAELAASVSDNPRVVCENGVCTMLPGKRGAAVNADAADSDSAVKAGNRVAKVLGRERRVERRESRGGLFRGRLLGGRRGRCG